MVCAEERADCFIFYCKVCKEVGIESLQVKTTAALKKATRRDLAARNMLLKAPPPRMKQINMDSSLMDEQNDRHKFDRNKKTYRERA